MDLLVQFPDHITAEKVQWWMDCGMQAGWDMTATASLPATMAAAAPGAPADRLARATLAA